MSKVFKSIAPIGGAIVGGMTGGPVGALIGGSLGSSLSSSGTPNVSELAQRGGFTGNLTTPAFVMRGDRLAKADLSIIRALNTVPSKMGSVATQTGALRGNLAPMRAGLSRVGTALDDLRADVRPGFGRLTEARVRSIRDAGAENMGNLRESLARRGVMGSSFANDAVSRQRMATGQEEERARAEAAVEEVSMSRQLVMDQITRIGAELGLSQEERAILGQQAQVMASQASVFANILDRELKELSIAGNIRNGVANIVNDQAIQQAALQAGANSDNTFTGAMMTGAVSEAFRGGFAGGGRAFNSLTSMFGGV